MDAHPQPPTGGTISLQKIVDQHLKRLRSLQDRTSLLLNGLANLSEAAHGELRRALPPEPLADAAEPFPLALAGSGHWLGTHYLSEIFGLCGIYVEQLRQFLILLEVSKKPGADAEKAAEAAKRIEARPATIGEAIQILGAMLPKGFPRQEEIQSLQRLHQLFAELAAGQTPTAREGTIVLCRPDLKPATAPGNFEVQRLTLNESANTKAVLSRDLLYHIFFTTFVLSRELAEATGAAASESLRAAAKSN